MLLLAAPPALSQGTAADYRRAAELRERFAGKVLNASIVPRWLPGGEHVWFELREPNDNRRYVLVDTKQATLSQAFDVARAAESLSDALDRTIDPSSLRLVGIDHEGQQCMIRLAEGGETYAVNLVTYETAASLASAGFDQSTVAVLKAPAPSVMGGGESHVQFVNRTPHEVELYWCQGNRRVGYGKLAAGAERSQHTFAGHVWLVTTSAGKFVNAFRAAEFDGLAVINGVPRPMEQSRPPQPQAERNSPRRGTSPDGRLQAFVQDHNVWIRNLEDDTTYPLSTSGDADNSYGGRLWWSPDSTRLVALQTKPGSDRKVYYVESSPSGQTNPKLHSYAYRKPGDAIPTPRVRLFDLESQRETPIVGDIPPNPWSITNIHWQDDSAAFSFLFNQRGHQQLQLISVDAGSGETRVVVDEQASTFVCYSHKTYLKHLPKTDELIWMSERDGHNHLYLYDALAGSVSNQITQGEWVVRRVIRVDEQKRQLWFEASGIHPGQDPYFVHIARVNFDGTGLVLLTHGDGNHRIQYSPTGEHYIDSWSRVDLPPVHELRRSDDGSLVSQIARADHSQLVASGWTPPEAFVAKGRDDATDIHGVILRPTNFDPDKKYPVIEHIYAGPHSAFVPKSFRAYRKMQELAELGFIVVKIDGMGTSHRSKAFHDVCWKNLGDSGFPDRIRWIKAAAKRHPEMDLSRVGIYGGSAGGQSSTRALLAHGDFYHVAVSDCGCHDNRVDKIWWNEQWMGWPIGPHYAEQSNVTQAHKLRGKLLLIVGEMDENVDPASTMQVVNALVKADRDFQMLVIPGHGHGAAESPYGQRRRADFFVRRLLGVEPRH